MSPPHFDRMQEHARHSGEWGGQGRPLAVYKARRAFSSHSVLEALGLDTAIELSQKLPPTLPCDTRNKRRTTCIHV